MWLCFSEVNASQSAHWPYKWTGRMALTLRPAGDRRTSSTAVAERLKVAGSMSARSGWAPQRRMALTLAKKLKGVVMTASPGPMLAAARASQMASVPLAQPMA